MSLFSKAPLVALFTLVLPLAAAAQVPTVDFDRCQVNKLNHAARYYSAAVLCVTRSERGGRDPRLCLEKVRARFALLTEREDQKGDCLAPATSLHGLLDVQIDQVLAGHAPPKRIFRTSSTFSGDLGGVRGADRICRQHARAGGLKGRFVALLSTSRESARDRVSLSPGGFVRPDGVYVARSADDLFDGALFAGIHVDEHGQFYAHNAEAWTGSDGLGRATGSTCEDWTSSSVAAYGINGLTHATNTSAWMAYSQFCNRTNVVLYCVEQ